MLDDDERVEGTRIANIVESNELSLLEDRRIIQNDIRMFGFIQRALECRTRSHVPKHNLQPIIRGPHGAHPPRI